MGHSEHDPAAQGRRLLGRAKFDLAIGSKLRGCDAVAVRIGDLVSGGQFRSPAIVIPQKIGEPIPSHDASTLCCSNSL